MTTNFRVAGTVYDLEDATKNTHLNVLVHMTKRLHVTLKDVVLGLSDLAARYNDAGEQREAGHADAPSDMEVMLDLLSDEQAVMRIQALIWLVRTQAGERHTDGGYLTIEQATEGIGFMDLQFINDREAEVVDLGKAVDQPVAAPS